MTLVWAAMFLLATTAIALFVAQLLKHEDQSIVDDYRCVACDARFYQCRTTERLCCETCKHVPPNQNPDS